MRAGLWLPLFEELADPGAVARLAADAEERGWHGVFVWDQLRWREPIKQVADPWITLAAIAAVTEEVMLGPMVTPLARRRPAKVARETATLDRLSGGRLILGVGLGGDQFAGEFSKTGEQVDDRTRGQMLDEALAILVAAWSGEPVNHRGKHYLIDDVKFLPRPVQRREYQCGLRRSRETSSRCEGQRATTGSSRSTSKVWMSSRKPWRPSASCAAITGRLMTSPSSFVPAAMLPHTQKRAPLGG